MPDNDSFGRDVALKRRSLDDKADAFMAHLRALIEQEIPTSRDRSIALTYLETTMLWVHRAIASAEIGAD